MFCQKCGAEIKDGDAFCPSCGTKVSAASASVAESKDSNKDLKGFDFTFTAQRIITLIGAVLGIICCFLPYCKRSEAGMLTVNPYHVSMRNDLGTRLLIQEGGFVILILAIAVAITVFKKNRFAYRVLALLLGIMSFTLAMSADMSGGERYIHSEGLAGATALGFAGALILVGFIMDFAKKRAFNS